jgi:NAD+ synthase (glutamine-hydrolysing)
MDHANKFNGLVISTANKTETALGYATLYGDMCGAIAPLADISKLKVYTLASYINQHFDEKIPDQIIDKTPTAELREGQTDEASLGGSYSVISPLVDDIIEKLETRDSLYKKYPKKLVDKIYGLINKSEYKRRQASPAIKVTRKAFGLGRRIPIAHKFQN